MAATIGGQFRIFPGQNFIHFAFGVRNQTARNGLMVNMGDRLIAVRKRSVTQIVQERRAKRRGLFEFIERIRHGRALRSECAGRFHTRPDSGKSWECSAVW